MKKVLRIIGCVAILFAAAIFVLRGVMGISFVMGDKTFYPPAGYFLSADADSFSFVVLSDTGSQNRTLQGLVRDARNKFNPKFILHLGDLVVYRNIEHMYWMMDELDDKLKGIPLYLVPGNHDVKKKKGTDKTLYERVFGPRYYWFGYGNTLFIGLDSSTKEIDENQWTFFERVMQRVRPGFRHVILFTHIPPVAPDDHPQHTLNADAVERMNQMLKKYPVDAIFTGHVHYYSEQKFAGIPLYTTPPSGQYFVGPVHKFGYLVVNVDSQGVHVQNMYSDRKKSSEWWDILFVDLVLTNKVRWIAGIILLVGLLIWLSGQKWLRFSMKRAK
ncbi:MAG: metallophosphoesterase [Alphaproteobacteria bacterium]|nr:metallophosphoesterase [Alphaproteobacteria bacterium]